MENTWPPNVPDTLLEVCIRYCVKNLDLIATREKLYQCPKLATMDVEDTDCLNVDHDLLYGKYEIRPGVFLTKNMCDRMVDILTEEHGPLTDDILAMFSNSQAAQLSCIDLRHSDVTCEGLQALRCQPLTELSMHCQWSCFPVIKALHRTLRSLRLDKMAAVVDPIHLRPLGLYDRGISGVISAGLEQSRESSPISVFDEDSQFFALTCPNLRKLVLQDLKLVGSPLAESFVKIMLSPLGRLTHLSLAGTSVQLEQLDCFGTLTGLVSLNISNIPISDFPTVLQNLSCLSNLR